VTAVAFRPGGSVVAVASGGKGRGLVDFWDVTTGKQVGMPYHVSEGNIADLAFSRTGGYLAAGLFDRDTHQAGPSRRGDEVRIAEPFGAVILWDVETGQRLGPPVMLKGAPVSGLAFSPDGTALAAGLGRRLSLTPFEGSRTGVLLTDVDPTSWRNRAARLANRNFSRAEWQQYMPAERKYHATLPDLPAGQEVEPMARTDRGR
jgi:WD40 repeat protein